MSTADMRGFTEQSPSKTFDREREKWTGSAQDKSFGRSVEAEPKPQSWMILAAGAAVPLGLACAAAVATYLTDYERVAIAAWVAVAVVGTASVISAAAVSRHRVKTVDRDKQDVDSRLRSNEASKMKND
jgi:hypothetical protein